MSARRCWAQAKARGLAVLAFLATLAVAAKDADVLAVVPDRWRPYLLGAAAVILLFSRAVHEAHPPPAAAEQPAASEDVGGAL